LSQAAENDIFKFKGRGPFKFKKKYPAAKHYTNIYRLVLLLTQLSFRWTVPLNTPYLISKKFFADKHWIYFII
jgi:hypothetical protein